MTAPPDSSIKPRSGWPRRLLLGFSAVMLTFALVLGGLFAGLRSEWGQARLATALSNLLSTDDQAIAISGLSGALPGEIRLAEVALADRDGRWLVLREARFEWSLAALLEGRVQVIELTASEIHIARPPATSADSSPEEAPAGAPFRLRDLAPPLPVEVARLSVARLVLGAPLLGEELDLSLDASGAATPGRVALQARLLEEAPTGLVAEVDFELVPDQDRFTAALSVNEPPGGRLAGLLGQPGDAPLSLELDGEGNLSRWDGALFADLGAGADAALAIALRRGEELTLRVEGTTRPAPLLPPDVAALAEPAVDLAAELAYGEDVLRVDALSLESAAVSVEGRGSLNLSADEIAADGRIALLDSARLTPLVEPLLIAGGESTFQVAGPPDAPALKFQPRLEQLSLPGLFLEELSAEIDVALAEAPKLSVTAQVEGFTADEPLLQAMVGSAPSLAAALESDAAFQEIALSDLRLSADGLALAGAARLRLSDAGVEIAPELRLDLTPTEAALPVPLSGTMTLSGDLAIDQAGRPTGRLRAAGQSMTSPEPLIEALLGPQPNLAIAFAQDEDAIVIDDAVLDAQALTARLTGRLDLADGDVSGRLQARVPDSAILAEQVAGALDITAEVSGSLDTPAVSAALNAAALSLEGQRLPPLTATARAKLSGEERLDLMALEVALGATRVSGRAEVDLSSTLARGDLALAAPTLAELATIADLPVTGALTGTLSFAPDSGRQGFALRTEAQRLDYDDITIATASLAVDGSLTAEDADYRYRLAAQELRPPELSVARMTVEGEGTLESVAFSIDAEGRYRERMSLAASGSASQTARGVALDLASLRLDHGEDTLSLRQPAKLALSGEGYSGALDADFNGGSITAEVEVATRAARLSLVLDDLPLAPAVALADLPVVKGALSGRLDLAGQPSRPEGEFALNITGLGSEEAADVPPLDGRLSGTYAGRRLAVTGEVAGLSDDAARLSLGMPLTFSLAPFAVAVPEDGALDGSLLWDVRLTPLANQLGLDDHLVSGDANIDLRVAGSLAAPELFGTLALPNGRYENLEYGSLLEDLVLRAELAGDRVVISELSAGDGADGRLSGEGEIALREDGEGEARLTLAGFRLAQGDQLFAQLSGDIAFSGTPLDHLISGRFTTEVIDIDVGQDLPPSVVTLPVQEVALSTADGAGPVADAVPDREEAEEEPDRTPGTTALDVSFEVPDRLFVRGRGLDSEWRGYLAIGGTADEPLVEGLLEPVRGSFSFAGKTFNLERGSIRRLKEQSEPFLDLVLVYKTSDLTARVTVSGTVDDPEIELTSEPARPQEEIIATILFGRSTGQLSAAEALQVAQTGATLSGGGRGDLNPLARARRVLQLDTLTVKSDEAGSSRLDAGAYVSEDVYVGFEQGLEVDSSTAKAEYEVIPNIFLEGRSSVDATNDVGVRWQLDY